MYCYSPVERSEGSADVINTEDWKNEGLVEAGVPQVDYSPLRHGMLSWPAMPMCEVY